MRILAKEHMIPVGVRKGGARDEDGTRGEVYLVRLPIQLAR